MAHTRTQMAEQMAEDERERRRHVEKQRDAYASAYTASLDQPLPARCTPVRPAGQSAIGVSTPDPPKIKSSPLSMIKSLFHE